MFDEHDSHIENNEEQELQNSNFVEYELAAAPQKKKKRGGGAKIVAFALACAIIGGVAGGGAVYLANRDSDAGTTEAATLQAETSGSAETTAETTSTGSDSSSSSDSSPLLVTSGENKTTKLDPSEVYSQNVNAVVGINTETTTNYFGQASSTASSGSGFIITSDGYVVTNAHVILSDDEVADTIRVVLTSGDTYVAEVVGYDSDNDVALLKIDATGLPTVSIGNSDELVVGEMVCAIGNPLGELTNTLTVGYVSALDREINTDGTPVNMFQTDCAINPGNSGGPLFDMYGNVVGITTAKYSTSSSTTLEGLGFALPINDVMEIVSDLQQYGYVTGKPYLGITLTDLSVTMASYYNLPVGVYVNSVESGSCAETAGMQAGDIITAMGDTQIQTYTELSAAMREYSAGDTCTITVYRNGQYVDLTVTFDEKIPDYVRNAGQETEAESQSTDRQTGSQSYDSYEDFFNSIFGGSSYYGSSENSGTAA